MRKIRDFLDDRLYPSFSRNWDDNLFRKRILDYIGRDSWVLDVGAGAGIVPQMNFSKVAKRVAGIDPDERVRENIYLHDAYVGLADNLPFADNTFDVVFADNVLEHLADPPRVFREINRVLKPGGIFLAKTPNAWHYMPLVARITPHAFHKWVNRIRGRAEVDTFPTLYRANTKSRIRTLADNTGFRPISIETIEGRPEYLRFSLLSYLIGFIYERVVNSASFLGSFRIVLIVSLRKTS